VAAPGASGSRRFGGGALLVGLACLVIGAAAGVAAGYALHDSGSETRSPLERVAAAASADPTPGDATTETVGGPASPADERSQHDAALMNRVPASDLPCSPREPEGNALATVICGPTPEDIVTIYAAFPSTAALREEYAGVLSEVGVKEGQTLSPCPNVVPSTFGITRGEVVVGNLVCFEYEGRQWIGWTNEPLKEFVFANAPEGMSATTLHEWWQKTTRPILSDNEVAFYARVPESHRASCTFDFVSFSPVQAVPPPERGSEATCVVANPEKPDDSNSRIGVKYTQHFGAEAMNRAYAAAREELGAKADAGRCPNSPPGEGVWKQDGKDAGRYACAMSQQQPVIAWTTDAVMILSLALGTSDLTLEALWEWWAKESGPLFRSG
jgi:hypothetical protein